MDSADPFLRLPADLLTHLASYIYLRPRLLILSVLNKRWHACVLKSITVLGRSELGIPLARISTLPALTDLCLDPTDAISEAVLPTTLQALTLFHHDGVIPAPAHYLPSLTSLIAFHDAPSDFVLKYATALETLHLPYVRTDELDPQLVRHYPRLTSLSIEESAFNRGEVAAATAIGRLIALHTDQLTDLDLSLQSEDPAQAPALLAQLRPFPRLRTFSFFGTSAWFAVLRKLLPHDCKVIRAMIYGTLTQADCHYVTELARAQLPQLGHCSYLTSLTILDVARTGLVAPQGSHASEGTATPALTACGELAQAHNRLAGLHCVRARTAEPV